MNINKEAFIQQLVDKHHYTKKSATALVNDFWDLVVENLENGNSVFFYGLGCFDLLERAERHCLNPVTKEKCVSPAHWIPRFYPGNTLRRAVKKWEDNNKRGLI